MERLRASATLAKKSQKATHTRLTLLIQKVTKYKFTCTFCMRTNDSLEDYTDPIDDVIYEMLLPTLLGQLEP